MFDSFEEAEETLPRAEVDESETDLPLDATTELTRRETEFGRERGFAPARIGTNQAKRPAHGRRSEREAPMKRREELRQTSLYRGNIGRLLDSSEELRDLPERGSVEGREGFDARPPARGSSREELRSQRDHVEFEIGRRFDELVVDARFEEDDVTGTESEKFVTDAESRAPSEDDVELGLGVEVTRAAEGGLVPPRLGPAPGEHRKGLMESVHVLRSVTNSRRLSRWWGSGSSRWPSFLKK